MNRIDRYDITRARASGRGLGKWGRLIRRSRFGRTESNALPMDEGGHEQYGTECPQQPMRTFTLALLIMKYQPAQLLTFFALHT